MLVRAPLALSTVYRRNAYQLRLKFALVLQTLPDVVLPEARSRTNQVVYQPEILLGFFLLGLERLAILVDNPEAVELLLTIFGEALHLGHGLLDGRLVLGRPDDVLQVLKKAVVILIGALGLHLGDGLDFTLDGNSANGSSGQGV